MNVNVIEQKEKGRKAGADPREKDEVRAAGKQNAENKGSCACCSGSCFSFKKKTWACVHMHIQQLLS